MRLRERTQVDYKCDTVLDPVPVPQPINCSRGRASMKGPALPSCSDEIVEVSETIEKSDAISDDSSNSDGELPIATKVTGRLPHQKQKSKRQPVGVSAGDNDDDDFVETGRKGAKKAAPANSLFKYLKPNVSNVADAPRASNAGSDSDDVFEAAPPSLQAGRRKRKVVAHPRGSRGRGRCPSGGSLYFSEGDDESSEQGKLENLRKESVITRVSTRAVREAKVSYKDASSSDEEPDAPVRSMKAEENPPGSPETKDDATSDNAKDFINPEGLSGLSGLGATESKGAPAEGTDLPGSLKFYSRQNRVQSKRTKLTLGEERHVHVEERRLRRNNQARNLKDASSSDEDDKDAGKEMHAYAGERCSQRATRARILNACCKSVEDDGDVEVKKVRTEVAAVSGRKLRRLNCASTSSKQHSSESTKENEFGEGLFPEPIEADVERDESVTIFSVGMYGIEKEGDGTPVSLSKRIGRVEKILSVRRNPADSSGIFCVKEYKKCYRAVVNVKDDILLKHCPQLLRNFQKRMGQLGREEGHSLDHKDSPAFDPLFTKIDRIIAQEQEGKKKFYLVKWCRLPYSEATWEKEEDLAKDKLAICRFQQFSTNLPHAWSSESSTPKVFKDGRALRDYQEAGVAWLDFNFQNCMNCVLADEMGLGKTIQSVAMLETLRYKRKIRGPFLVIAPVSTLGHWQREIETLTNMNCVVYSGTQEDRDIIRQYEFHFPSNSKMLKFNVLLTSFEMLMKDQNKFAKESWKYIIVDEAHRLKSKESKTTQSLRQLQIRNGGLLLLTGTPVQNNTREIFSLLNLLDPEKFSSEQDFMDKYGEIKDAEQIKDIQDNVLRPRLLRRMKEDVEKSIPQKEETIVWVELTKDQRAFYKGIFENNIGSLLKGASSNNIPNLRNVAMELRKICNHPFLCDGLEANLVAKHAATEGDAELSRKLLQQSSGKMILIDKLLPKLKDAGRRVLIFSQFTIMLDLLEDYLVLKGYSFERIDGKIRGSERQAAIDRYSAKDSNIFVFLLSTRAGGLGITLTAADTCIIYDSDWNPQNDLQAMARCHRIGQTKDVKIYRLITRNTYEQRLFECSSRKYGLDEAILGNRLGEDVNVDHDKNIESLLKHGAYDIMKGEEEEAAAEFTAQDIDQILEQRTQQRQIGGRGNNTFSVATFRANPDAESEWAKENLKSKQDSKEFWQELMPEACERAVAEAIAAEATADAHPGGLRKRTRGRVDYRENAQSLGEGPSDEIEEEKPKKSHRKHERSSSGEFKESEDDTGEIDHWNEKELKRLEDRLIVLGRGRTDQIRDEAHLAHRSVEEINEISDALIELCQSYVDALENQTPVSTVPTHNMGRERTSSTEALTAIPDFRGSVGQIVSPLAPESSKSHHLQPRPVVLPAVVKALMESQACKERIQRNAQRYLQQLHERNVLADAIRMRYIEFMHIPFRSKKLPHWWGKQEDEDLMRAAYNYGHKDFKRIKSDNTLSFVKRFAVSTSYPVDVQVPSKDDYTVGEEDQDTMPSDQVLGSRLKKLIEALPNGLSNLELKKRAIRAEASRKFIEQRKLVAKPSPDETKTQQFEMTDKSLAEWVSSSKKDLKSSTEVLKDLDNPGKFERGFKIPAPPKKFDGASNVKVHPLPIETVMSAKKPLSPTNHNSVVSREFLGSPNLPHQKMPKKLQENEVPKRNKLSLSFSGNASKKQKEAAIKQTSMRSFLKSNLSK